MNTLAVELGAGLVATLVEAGAALTAPKGPFEQAVTAVATLEVELAAPPSLVEFGTCSISLPATPPHGLPVARLLSWNG